MGTVTIPPDMMAAMDTQAKPSMADMKMSPAEMKRLKKKGKSAAELLYPTDAADPARKV